MNGISHCLFWLFEEMLSVQFFEYSKEGGLSSSHVGIQNIPSDVCYDGTKHYQVKSEHSHIQNHFTHLLRLSIFASTVNCKSH